MKLKDLNSDELEAMGYDDIAFIILKEKAKKIKIQDLFKKICEVLKLPDSVFENQIADFFELLSTDKRFIMVDGYFDLRDNHTQKVTIETDENDLILDSIDDIDYEDNEEEDEEDEDIDSYDEDDDLPENELKNLVIISEDEMESDDML